MCLSFSNLGRILALPLDMSGQADLQEDGHTEAGHPDTHKQGRTGPPFQGASGHKPVSIHFSDWLKFPWSQEQWMGLLCVRAKTRGKKEAVTAVPKSRQARDNVNKDSKIWLTEPLSCLVLG